MQGIVYNQNGKILRLINCPNIECLNKQAEEGEYVMADVSDIKNMKVIDVDSTPKLVKKTQQEIEAETPEVPKNIPEEEREITIVKKEWDRLLSRISDLENKVKREM